MRIDVTRIPKEGLEISTAYDPEGLELNTQEITWSVPINVSAKALKDNGHLSVDIVLEGTLHFICSRCLASFELPVSKRFRFDYQIEGQTILDISDDIRGEIILGYPLKPLCKEDCKGLCQLCGRNLNEGECNCGTT